MLQLLLPGAVLLAAAVLQSDEAASPSVQVERGRAVLVQRGSRGELLLPDDGRSVSGAAYLLVGAGAQASVRWRGCGSLRLTGPAEIEWRPGGRADEPVWSMLRLGAVDIEVRDGGPQLELPGGWSARLQRGAFHVDGGGRDACDFEVRAGDDLRLVPELRSGLARPPVVASAGMRVRLSDRLIEVSRPDLTVRAESWSDVGWPWAGEEHGREVGSVAIEPPQPVVTLDVRAAPQAEAHGARTIAAPEPKPREDTAAVLAIDEFSVGTREIREQTVRGQPVETTPEATTAAPEPVAVPDEVAVQAEDRPAGDAPAGASDVAHGTPEPHAVVAGPIPPAPIVPAPDAMAPVVSAPVVPAPDAPAPSAAGTPEPPRARHRATPPVATSASGFLASHWRGVDLSRLLPAGPGAVEKKSGVSVSQLAPGRWRVALDSRAPEPVWFFGRDEDVLIQPGAALSIGREAEVQSVQGFVQSEAAPGGRPLFGALAGATAGTRSSG